MHQLAFHKISGSHFSIGQQLGRIGKSVVHGYLVTSWNWKFLMNFRHDSRIHRARALVESLFPHYYRELEGMAAGLEIPCEDLFLWNCRGDLFPLGGEGCTTVQYPGTDAIVAHNEDGDPDLYSGCVLADLAYSDGSSFCGFLYPGSIPGNTFSVNGRNLAVTVNNIRSLEPGVGVPRMFIARAMTDCATVAEAVRLIENTPRAGAFHFTLFSLPERVIKSVEFTHRSVSCLDVTEASAHANHLVHPAIRHAPQIITASSHIRQVRSEQILGNGETDPTAILWDAAGGDFTLYRQDPHDADGENTLSTAIFHSDGRTGELTCTDRYKSIVLKKTLHLAGEAGR